MVDSHSSRNRAWPLHQETRAVKHNMGDSAIQRGSSVLLLFDLATMVWYGGSSHSLLAGVLYLLAASYLALICGLTVTRWRKKLRRGTPELAFWAIRRRASALLVFGWQLAIVGLLNIWAVSFHESHGSIVSGYCLAAVFIVLSYKTVALADSAEQFGGSKPVNYFGRPRSRRIFFCAFVYTPIGPLVILSFAWSGREWCPALLQPPELWLLLLALISTMSAGMIFQRYRAASPDKALAMKIIVSTTFGLACTTLLQVIFAYGLNVYVLSSLTLACIAAISYWLSLAEPGSSPEML